MLTMTTSTTTMMMIIQYTQNSSSHIRWRVKSGIRTLFTKTFAQSWFRKRLDSTIVAEVHMGHFFKTQPKILWPNVTKAIIRDTQHGLKPKHEMIKRATATRYMPTTSVHMFSRKQNSPAHILDNGFTVYSPALMPHLRSSTDSTFLRTVLTLRQSLQLDLPVGSSRSTWVDLGLPSGVKSVCSSVTVEMFWRRRSYYESFQVDFNDLTNNLAPSSSLKRGYRWVWANRAICNIFQ